MDAITHAPTLLDDPALCALLQDSPCERSRRQAAEELLRRHERAIRVLARKAARHPDASGDYDDALGQARLAALRSYSTYDPTRGCAVTTHLHYVVLRCFGDANARERLIRVPERLRKARAYLLGRSNEPTFVGRFEREVGVRTDEDRGALRLVLGGLAASFAPLDEARNTPSHKACLPDRLDLVEAIEELPKRDWTILSMVVGGHSHAEIANVLGESEDRVKNRLFAIRRKLRKRIG